MIRAQFAVIIDLAIRDQGGSAGEERLIACRKINDCKAGLGESDIARKMMPRAIRPAMRQRARERFQHCGGRGCSSAERKAGYAAHGARPFLRA